MPDDLWAVTGQFVSTIVFWFIFGSFARLLDDGIPYPRVSYMALVPWT